MIRRSQHILILFMVPVLSLLMINIQQKIIIRIIMLTLLGVSGKAGDAGCIRCAMSIICKCRSGKKKKEKQQENRKHAECSTRSKFITG